MTILISGFPNVGKTYLVNNPVEDLIVKEINSSDYNVEEYKEEIYNQMETCDVILLDVELVTLETVRELGRQVIVVVPGKDKDTWIRELKESDDDVDHLIERVQEDFEGYLKELNSKADYIVYMEDKMYMSDFVKELTQE